MPDDIDTQGRQPTFEIVTFSEPTGIPNHWDRELLREGVAKDLLGAYQAASELTLKETPTHGQLVCFGTYGPSCSMCLSPRTGEVVEVIDVPNGPIWLVNSSLERFTESVRAVVNRFPFDNEDTVQPKEHTRDLLENEWDPVADELTAILREIDPVCVANPDGFWMTFVDDVRMGDFSTRLVLGDSEM